MNICDNHGKLMKVRDIFTQYGFPLGSVLGCKQAANHKECPIDFKTNTVMSFGTLDPKFRMCKEFWFTCVFLGLVSFSSPF
jgi:hypothetical protein